MDSLNVLSGQVDSLRITLNSLSTTVSWLSWCVLLIIFIFFILFARLYNLSGKITNRRNR